MKTLGSVLKTIVMAPVVFFGVIGFLAWWRVSHDERGYPKPWLFRLKNLLS